MKTMKNVQSFYIFFLFIIMFINPYSSFSQSKYGNTTMEELNMEVYPNDSTAPAVILLKTGETRFSASHESFQFEYTVKVKIKILKESGLEWCNQEISYYEDGQSKENIIRLSGTTYTLDNGKINKTKLSKDYIFNENINDKWKVRKFTMPGAKVGSIIEFNYTLQSPFFYELRDFELQSTIPTAYTSYDIIIPEYYLYNVNMQGYERVESERSRNNMSFVIRYRDSNGRLQTETVTCLGERMKFKGQDLPALKPEPYMWSLNNYKTKITFELKKIQFPHSNPENYTTTWENIDQKLFETSDFGGNLNKTGLFKNQIQKGEATIDRAEEILEYIKNKVRWNEKTAFYPNNLNEALKSGLGNSSDMNFLLINALNAGGFEAYPVAISTRNNGLLPMAHPTISAFNYVITAIAIDSTLYFTDASARYGDWNILPSKCMVTQARILKKKSSFWKDISDIATDTSTKMAVLEFTESGLTTKITESNKDFAAYYLISNYNNHKNEEEYTEKLSARMGGDVSDFKMINDDSRNIKVEYTLTKDQALGDEYLYINPMFEKYFSENPFKAETRKFPINFGSPINYKLISNIKIPAGYIIEELPKSEKITTDGNSLSLNYIVGQNDDQISLSYNLQLKKIMFIQNEYDLLKDFFSKLVLKNSEQIVLKKKN